MLSTTLSEFDNIRFEFFIGIPNTGCLDRFEFSMIGENWNTCSIKRNILNVGIVHQNVHLAIANQVATDVVEEFRLGLLGDFHTVGLDDFVHGSSKVSFRVAIDLFDVGSE